MLSNINGDETLREATASFIQYVNRTVSTLNPAISMVVMLLMLHYQRPTHMYVIDHNYADVNDVHEDLKDLIATCQRHTRCSAAYCLRTRNGVQACCFGYPKDLHNETALQVNTDPEEMGEPELITARNDGLINSYNPVQLSGWRANVDMQYCLSKKKVIEYITKYATKCEPRSQTMNEVYANIVRSLKDDSTSLKVVQKLLINSVGERDYSAQETCHLFLQLPLTKSTRDITILSLDGSRQVEEQPDQDTRATAPSILDHYIHSPHSTTFDDMKLLHFAQNYSMPKETGTTPKHHKMKVVIVRMYCSPDPDGPKYEQYCKQKLMLHVPFRHVDELKGDCDSFAAAYALFLQSGNVPSSLEDDMERLRQHQTEQDNDDEIEVMLLLLLVLIILCLFYIESIPFIKHSRKTNRRMDVNLSL